MKKQVTFGDGIQQFEVKFENVQVVDTGGIKPTGTLAITENGTYDVTQFANANVDVPIPDGYLKPDGTLVATQEGVYDVAQYASADFSVQKQQASIIPTQETQTITPSKKAFFDKVVVEAIPSEYIVPNGVLAIDRNGEYDVASYAQAVVNTPDMTGTPIEVTELPIPTAEDIGKVYKVGDDYYVGEPKFSLYGMYEQILDKIYFDTRVDVAEAMKGVPVSETVTVFDLTDGWTQDYGRVDYMKMPLSSLGVGEGYMHIVFRNKTLIYVSCDSITVEQFNEMVLPSSGMDTQPITAFGWQMSELDMTQYSNRYFVVDYNRFVNGQPFAYKDIGCVFTNIDDDETGIPINVTELPTPTTDDNGKVYKVGENYYVGDVELADFTVGETIGDKIYFDTSVNIADYGSVVTAEGFLAIMATSDTAQYVIMVGEIFGGGDMGTCYIGICGDMSTGGPPLNGIVYVQADVITVEQFNEMVVPELGLPPISNFGWQTDVLDTSAYADCIVQESYLAEVGNFARKSGNATFKPLDTPPILQEKTVTENGEVVADSGFDGLSKVTVNVASSGGGEAQATLTALIDGSLTEIENDAQNIAGSLFYNRKTLTSVSFPKATSIEMSAFNYCTVLTNVNFPNVTNIGDAAFGNCTALTNVTFPSATSIGTQIFYRCTALNTVNFPNATNVGKNALRSCTSLTSVNAPNVTSIEDYAFQDCTSLTNIDFPNVTNIKQYSFSGCTALTSVNFPNLTTINAYTFQNCSSLKSVDFPQLSTTNTNVFKGCSELEIVKLPSLAAMSSGIFCDCASLRKLVIGTNTTTVVKFTGLITDAFKNCYHILGTAHETYNPDGLKDGYIYVPDNLVDSYKSATNWSAYGDQIKGISEFTME